MRVLVTGARTYYSLAVIRRLHRDGHSVTAADWHPRSLGFYSCHTEARFVHPPVGSAPEAFADALCAYLRLQPQDIVLPLYEEAFVLARHRARVQQLTRVPVADYAQLMCLHDKRSLYALAESLGVAVPAWTVVRDDRVAMPFPIVLKVPQSSSAVGVAVVERAAAVPAARVRLLRDHDLPPDAPLIAQQWIDGIQLCSLSFAWHGVPKGTLVYRNLCEFPARGGAGIARESVRHDAVAASVAKILATTSYHGILGCDFFVERATGRVLLLDANPRPTPAMLLAELCGLDLVGMSIGDREPQHAPELRLGVRTRIDPLVALWCLRRLLPQRGYWAGLRQACAFLRPKEWSHSDVFARDDLRSLLGLFWAAGEAASAWLHGGLATVTRPSQFHDYAAGCGS